MKKGKRQWLAWMMAVILLVTLLPASVFASEELFQDGTVTEQEPVTEIVPAPEENPALEENSTPEENPVLEENPTSDEESVPQDEPALEENPGEEDSREQLFGDGTGDMTESAAVDLAGAVGFSAEEVPLFSAGETAGEVPSGGEGITDADYTLYYNHTDGKLHKNSIGGDVVETGEGFSYSGSGSKLTLSGFHFTTTAATGLWLPSNSTLEVTGDNTIHRMQGGHVATYGIYVEYQYQSEQASLIIEGSGSLSVFADGADQDNYGLAGGSIVIESGILQFHTGGQAYGSYGISAWHSLCVNGGEVTSTGGTASNESIGVQSGGNIQVGKTAVLNGTGGTSQGIAGGRSIGIASNATCDFSRLTTGIVTAKSENTAIVANNGIKLSDSADIKTGANYGMRGMQSTDRTTIVSDAQGTVAANARISKGLTADYTLYYNNSDGKFHKDSINGEIVESQDGLGYSGSGSTLTLSGFRFTTSAATGVVLPDGTTLEVTGDNSITMLDNSIMEIIGLHVAASEYVLGDCILKGTGGLTIAVGGTSYVSNGIKANTLTIQGGEYQIFGTAAGTSYGVYCKSDLMMEGGKLVVGKGQRTSGELDYGVLCNENLKLKGDSVLSVEREAAIVGAYVDNFFDFSELTTGTITLAGSYVAIHVKGKMQLPVPAEVKEGPDYTQDADLGTTKDVRITKGAAKPEITGQPAGAVYPWGSVAVQPLEVKAQTSDTGELTYQWFSNTENNTTGGSAITGADAGSYSPDITTAGTLYYYCVVTNTWNQKQAVMVSDSAAVTVLGPTLYYNDEDGKLYQDSGFTMEYTEQSDKWSGSGNQLTLQDFVYTTTGNIGLVMPEGSTLYLAEGTINSIASTFRGEDFTSGIRCDENLDILGQGTLTVSGGSDIGSDSGGNSDRGEKNSYGIWCSGDLTVTDGNLHCYGGDVGEGIPSPVYSTGIGIEAGDAKMTNAVVTATGGKAAIGCSIGMSMTSNGELQVENGSLTALGADLAMKLNDKVAVPKAAEILASRYQDGTDPVKLDAFSMNITDTNYLGNYRWIHLSEVRVQEIKLNKTSTTLLLGNTITLKAAMIPEDVSNKEVSWKSSKESVATVSPTGKVKAVGLGSATITCTARDGSGKKAACKVTVKGTATRRATLKTKAENGIITIWWTKVNNASGYDIYGAKCGDPVRLLKTSKNEDVFSWKPKNPEKTVNYKFCVKAYKIVNGNKIYIKTTNAAHLANTWGRYTNARQVQTNFSSVTLSPGKTKQIKAVTIKIDEKKPLLKHLAEFRYFTSEKEVATVSKDGKITVVGKGDCSIYVYANNGICKKIAVAVR